MLAEALVHEFMHTKLGGLMHLFTMTDGPGSPCLYAPWRDDPRPASGLLQGIYAFFGIADFWRRERSWQGDPLAEYEYAKARAQTVEALGTAQGDGNLTDTGRLFAQRIADEVHAWPDDLAEETRYLLRLATDGHRAGWRIRHRRPDPATVVRLARAWEAGATGPLALGPFEVLPDPQTRVWSTGRLGLGRWRIAAPDRFAQARQTDWGGALTEADLALYAGDTKTATIGFLTQIDRDPGAVDAWTGLGLALGSDRMAPARAAAALLERPEVVLAVYRQIRSNHSPVDLAAWIGSQLDN